MSPLPATQTKPAWYSVTQFFDVLGKLVHKVPITVEPLGGGSPVQLYNHDGSLAANPLPRDLIVGSGQAGGADRDGNIQFGVAAGSYDLVAGTTYVGTIHLTAQDSDLAHSHGDETYNGKKTYGSPTFWKQGPQADVDPYVADFTDPISTRDGIKAAVAAATPASGGCGKIRFSRERDYTAYPWIPIPSGLEIDGRGSQITKSQWGKAPLFDLTDQAGSGGATPIERAYIHDMLWKGIDANSATDWPAMAGLPGGSREDGHHTEFFAYVNGNRNCFQRINMWGQLGGIHENPWGRTAAFQTVTTASTVAGSADVTVSPGLLAGFAVGDTLAVPSDSTLTWGGIILAIAGNTATLHMPANGTHTTVAATLQSNVPTLGTGRCYANEYESIEFDRVNFPIFGSLLEAPQARGIKGRSYQYTCYADTFPPHAIYWTGGQVGGNLGGSVEGVAYIDGSTGAGLAGGALSAREFLGGTFSDVKGTGAMGPGNIVNCIETATTNFVGRKMQVSAIMDNIGNSADCIHSNWVLALAPGVNNSAVVTLLGLRNKARGIKMISRDTGGAPNLSTSMFSVGGGQHEIEDISGICLGQSSPLLGLTGAGDNQVSGLKGRNVTCVLFDNATTPSNIRYEPSQVTLGPSATYPGGASNQVFVTPAGNPSQLSRGINLQTATITGPGQIIYSDPTYYSKLRVTVTTNNAFTINIPGRARSCKGTEWEVEIINASGGAMGTITWRPAVMAAPTWTNPANGKSAVIRWYFDETAVAEPSWKQVGASQGVSVGQTNTFLITASNAAWPIPAGATLLKITCVGGGAGGGGAGSAAAAQLQAGGSGGGAGAESSQIVPVGVNTTLNVIVGAGGPGGNAGAAAGNPGTNGSNGVASTVTGTGISVRGAGGSPGRLTTASSTTVVNGGGKGQASSNVANVDSPGEGGPSAGTGGSPGPWAAGGGAGGGAATATLGGGGGGAGDFITSGAAAGATGASGTSAGVAGVSAAANSAGGGGGGGGGAAGTGAGGAGGNGGSGFVVIEVVG